MRLLIGTSLLGLTAAFAFHLAAFSGRVWGGEWPLALLTLAMFVCFGSAVLRGFLHGMENQTSRVDLGKLVPRWMVWVCGSAALYGFLAGFTHGKIYHQFGEMLSPEKAAAHYAGMIPFFSIALLLHVGLSAKKDGTGNQSEPGISRIR